MVLIMDEQARLTYNAYMREYRKKNKERMRRIVETYWSKKAEHWSKKAEQLKTQ